MECDCCRGRVHTRARTKKELETCLGERIRDQDIVIVRDLSDPDSRDGRISENHQVSPGKRLK